MRFLVEVDGRRYSLTLPPEILTEARDFFARMDADMDKGWQMSREWVEAPDRLQRCQIAAGLLAEAVEDGKETLAQLMAGYIVSRMPGARGVRVVEGDMLENEVLVG